MTSGSAFQKLTLIRPTLMTGDKKGVQNLVKALGGSWGRIDLELKYESAEKAIFRCQQRSDETNDSYLARADVLWAELLSKKMDMSELQAYILLRGSQLSSEDKKRVLLEADIKDAGELRIDRVSKAIRMLGAGFFQQVAGQSKTKGKIYDGTAFIAEDKEMIQDEVFLGQDETIEEEETIEALAAEGDEDAALILEYEAAAADTLQEDSDLATAYSAYLDARRRLSERQKNRGFWPTSSASQNFPGKGKWKSFGKGKGKGNFSGKGYRKPLQQRIMETECRICGKKGHWKAECPDRQKSPHPSQSTGVAATTVSVAESTDFSGLPLEFVELPELPIDETLFASSCFVCMGMSPSIRENLRIRGSRGNPYHVRIDAKTTSDMPDQLNAVPCEDRDPNESQTLFATHDSMGILDSGATKSVVGSDFVGEILDSLRPEVRKHVKRCQCRVTFRFGNQGVLSSEHALVIPIGRHLLKIAVVKGRTPLLISNTLVRALEGLIDTKNHTLVCQKISRTIPLQLNPKGLFLLDLNDLASPPYPNANCQVDEQTETFVSLSEKNQGAFVKTAPADSKCQSNQEGRSSNAVQKMVKFFENHASTRQAVLSQLRSFVSSRQKCSQINQCLRRIMPNSLTARFARLVAEEKIQSNPETEMIEFQTKSLDQMGQEIVTFGKTHQGKTFLHMWEKEPAWVKFMLTSYGQSQKIEHMKFLHFAETMIERKELEKGINPEKSLGKELVMPGNHPLKIKSKAKASMKPPNPPLDSSQEEESESLWDLMEPSEETKIEIQVLQQRMLNMENALSEVVGYIRAQQASTAEVD